ncbi:tetratricopeptide repeat-containing sulfotransferase family protein [Pseudidiomarina sp.]|uniref:tetratricopeptide repeat-containing sulfotransferase family protein n=1 Tax=Pseudidiomarina sp. TaxID=2081707 RepID=UPI003A9696C4
MSIAPSTAGSKPSVAHIPNPVKEALAAFYDGKIAVAEKLCRQWLTHQPTDVNAIRLLADIGSRLGRYGDAQNLLERCLELAPDFHLARYNYASVLSRQTQYEKAIKEINFLLKHDAEKPNYLMLKASTLVRLDHYAEAIRIYEQLVAHKPSQPKLYLSYGHALKTVGRTDEAISAYRHAIQLAPTLGEAYWSLANLKTKPLTDAEVATLEQALKQPSLKPDDAAQLSFALGKALDDRGDIDKAFKHYAEGNEVRRRLVQYSADEHQQRTEETINTLTADFFNSRQGMGHDDDAPIFIVGLPRAGSTLIEQILASHSQVEGTHELPNIINMARRLSGKARPADPSRYPAILHDLSADELQQLGQEYIEQTKRYRSGKPYFIDKMPNNFEHTGLIHAMLPNAKIIDARRHPLACCLSGFRQYFARGQRFSYSLTDIGRYYRDYVALMDHYDAVLPNRVYRVQYENMVNDTETEVRRLLDYCGLPFEEQCLTFYKNKRAVKTASSEQVRQPIFTSGMTYYRDYLPHLGSLIDALGDDVLARYSIHK